MFGPSPEQTLCQPCALRLADLASDRSENIWADVATRDGAPPPPTETFEDIDADSTFDTFKESVANQISDNDADSHLNLAAAYSAMGLYVDARREAAIVIGARSTAGATNAALQLLLSPPLLADGALDRLRERVLRPVN